MDTASGAIATFADGSDGIPVESLTVTLEPIQDLHGQDAPYPAGGWEEPVPDYGRKQNGIGGDLDCKC